MADNSNTGMPEDEKKTNDLLALLYPDEGAELDDSEFVSDDELGGMQSLRSLFRDMPEEEPSDAVTNKLMAMAAQHAPKPMEESRGLFAWFSDILMPLVSHPGLAAAATLVLVVGVAGTLYVKGGAQMAETVVSSEAERPAMQPASESTMALPESAELTERETAADKTVVAVDEGEAPSEDPAAATDTATGAFKDTLSSSLKEERQRLGDAPEAKPTSGKKDGARGAKRKSKKNAAPGGVLGSADLDDLKAADGFGKGGGGTSSGGRASGESNRGVGGKSQPAPVATTSPKESSAPSNAPAPKPRPEPKKKPQTKAPASPPPPPSPDFADAEEDSAGVQEKKQEQQGPSQPSASELHSKAVRAAKSGDCKRVLSIGNQIRKIDSAYYDRTFLSDARLKACRSGSKSK